VPQQIQRPQTVSSTTESLDDLAALASQLQSRAKIVQQSLEREITQVQAEKSAWELEKQAMAERFVIKSNIIEVNVGGTVFTTFKSVLCKHSESMLAAMFSGRHPITKDKKGRCFIDRDADSFRYILNFLRRDVMVWPSDPALQKELQLDLEFFNLLGRATFKPDLFAESIIVGDDAHLRTQLINLLGPISCAVPLYQCTPATWDVAQFHATCDNMGPTVTLLRAAGYIFGGYTPLSWDSSGTYKKDPRTFLFSLTNPANTEPVILPNTSGYNSKESIYCNAQYGPTFGQGHDIYIGENLQNCYTNFLYSFSHPTIPASFYTKPEAKNYFCGSHKFVPSELEVYQITIPEPLKQNRDFNI